MAELIELPFNRVQLLKNSACAYCGVEFSKAVPFDKEHAIGRRFVPKGTLAGQWNLLLQSCQPCNSRKALLENDISAIAMQPDSAGRFVNDDPLLREEARRKAKNAISRKTGKPVAAGEAPFEVVDQFGSMDFIFSMVSPPQVEENRLFELARFQIGAFFYWSTFDRSRQRGGLLPGVFAPLTAVRKADWGNPRLIWFDQFTKDWTYRVHAIGAGGYFKVVTKRKSDTEDIWSWALEWNQNFRLVGFFGDEGLLGDVSRQIPALEMIALQNTPTGRLRMRFEVPLAEADDTLFVRFPPPDALVVQPNTTVAADEAAGPESGRLRP